MNITLIGITKTSALSNCGNSSRKHDFGSGDGAKELDGPMTIHPVMATTRFPRAAPGYSRARAAWLASHTECNDGG